MTLNARHIEVIHAVAHTGSVTEAAALLDVSQPAVSMTLRECNKLVGFPLFERRQGRMQPTSETLVIIPEMEKILRDMQRIDQLVYDLRSSSVGEVRLAVAPAIAESLLPAAIDAFRRDRIQLAVTLEGTRDIAAEIEAGRADLGLALSAERATAGVAVDLGSTELVCLLHRGHALANRPFLDVDDIAAYPIIAFGARPVLKQIEAAFLARSLRPELAFEVPDGSTACALVQRQLGIGLVPASGVPPYRSADLIEREFRPRSELLIQLLLPARRNVSRAARRLSAALRAGARHALTPVQGTAAVAG